MRSHPTGLDRRQTLRVVGCAEGVRIVVGPGLEAEVRSWSPRAIEVVANRPLRPGAHLIVKVSLGRRSFASRAQVLRCWVHSLTGGIRFGGIVLLEGDPSGILGY